MNRTKIDWCDASWNPVTGCRHGCPYCYARNIAHRFEGRNKALTLRDCGVHVTEGGCYEAEDPIPNVRKNGKIVAAPFPFGFEPTFHSYRLDQPKRTKNPKRIFVCSMADLFGAWVPDEWIGAVFKACMEAPQHDYLFLTKNPRRYTELRFDGKLPSEKNFWYGVTGENHLKAAMAFQHLPAAWQGYNFLLSAEPLQGPINLPAFGEWPRWVILGAETGNRKGKCLLERTWIDDICAGADKTGAAVFMKNSLIPIVGEENMRQEFPAALRRTQNE